MKPPTPAQFKRAEKLVSTYRQLMQEKELELKAKEGQKYVGFCFTFGNPHYHEDYEGSPLTWLKVLGCGTRGYAILKLQKSSSHGEGLQIESLMWPFGMEQYFTKRITSEEFIRKFLEFMKRLSP
jgi:hypothetical protein